MASASQARSSCFPIRPGRRTFCGRSPPPETTPFFYVAGKGQDRIQGSDRPDIFQLDGAFDDIMAKDNRDDMMIPLRHGEVGSDDHSAQLS